MSASVKGTGGSAGCRQRDKVPVVSAAPSLDLRLSVPRAALWLVALKPLVDVFFESGPSVTLDLGVAYTGLGLILFAFWLATKRRAPWATWLAVASTAALVVISLALTVVHRDLAPLVEGSRVAAGLVVGLMVLPWEKDARHRLPLTQVRVFLAGVGVHVVGAFLQAAGKMEMTYFQSGSGRPSGFYYHPVSLGFALVASLLLVGVLHTRRVIGGLAAAGLTAIIVFACVLSTHRASLVAMSVVLVSWAVIAFLNTRRVQSRSVAVWALLGLAALGAAAAYGDAIIEVAEGAAEGVAGVITEEDLDPTSSRFLRGRGVRWALAVDVISQATFMEAMLGYGWQVVDPHSDYLRLALVHGVVGSLLVLSLLVYWGTAASQGTDLVGRAWVFVALATMAVYAITAKPTSYPSFMWAWALVLWVARSSTPRAAAGAAT